MTEKKVAKKNEITVAPNPAALAALAAEFPQEVGYVDKLLPRLTFKAQDVTEETKVKGKKVINILTEAGTFIEERETDELDEDGKKVWSHDELGAEIEGTIIFQRKQLKFYDEGTSEFTSSAVYDNDEEVIPLFLNKKEIARGTPAELRGRYQYTHTDGKVKSRLEDNVILYILKDDEIFQLNLRGSSMYAFKTFARKTLAPSVLIKMNSEAKENGSIKWNQMTFTPVRVLNNSEIANVMANIQDIKQGVADKKAFFASQAIMTPEEIEAKKNDF